MAIDIMDQLLKADLTKVTKPEKTVKIKRLSKELGFDFVVKCQAMTNDEFEEVKENAITISGSEANVDTENLHIFTVLKGVKSPNMKDERLMEKFGVPSPKDLVKKMFLPGEIADLYETIQNLSGFGVDTVEEVKND